MRARTALVAVASAGLFSVHCGGRIADIGDASTSNDAATSTDTSVMPPPPPVDSAPPPTDVTPPAACSPLDSSGFVPTWHAPKPPSSSCTTGDIDTIAATCFGGSMSACNAFQKANPTCWACLFSKESDPNYGAIVVPSSGTYERLFEGGCVAIEDMDLGPSGCGAQVEANYQCQMFSCRGCAPASDVESAHELQACMKLASKSACAKFQATVDTCVGDGGPASSCFAIEFVKTFQFIGNLMCAR